MPRSPDEIREEFARRRRHQIQFRMVVVVFAVVSVWLGSPAAQPIRFELQRRHLDGVFLAMALAAMIIAILAWRCPACNALLGRRLAQTKCPRCGASFL